MDCLEFRRILASTPLADHAELKAHRADCPACAAARERALEFERELSQALHVPAPEGLAESILLAHATGTRRRRSRGSRIALALAASLLLVLGAGGLAWQQMDAHSLPALAVAHMPDELPSLDLTQPISQQALAAGFAGRGLTLHGPMPRGTTYVHDCIVGKNHKAVHMVTRRDGEAVAVLYLPDTPVSHTRNFDRGSWRGREMPLGTGSLVMLTDQGSSAPFNTLAADWRTAIEGPTGSSHRHAPLAP